MSTLSSLRDRAGLADPARLDALRRAEDALRESEERFRTVVESLGEGLIISDLEGRILYVNPRIPELSGYAPEELVGKTVYEVLLPAEERETFLERVERRARGISERYEIFYLRKNGSRIWVEVYGVPFRDSGGEIIGTLGVVTDVTERKRAEKRLRQAALYDALTGLPNRLLFRERLDHAILRAKRREEYRFAVLFLDLDRFKVINDSLGHHVGDELLAMVAQRLRSCLRPEDSVARFGGDEFAILLEGIEEVSDATRVAERIQASLSAPVDLGGLEVFTSASIGIVLNSAAYERPEYLLRNADMAMYRAKAAGQARFEVFDRAMHARALSRLQMETDLRRALEREEFRVHYQPIISLETGRIMGLEALVRWSHPDQGWLPPDEFIPAAEETGLILPLGEWVLRESCRHLKRWQEQYPRDIPLSVGVNLSVKQFSQRNLVAQISRILEEMGLEPAMLKLEITESAAMENAEAAAVLLGRLKSLGVQLYLDDFGTGYSSLSYLHQFPLDALKIDRSFVGRVDTDDRNRQLVRTILTLAHSLGVPVIAEGIETESQRLALRRMGCGFGQGHLFSRPLAPEAVEALLARRT
jgi:diguanylate cyclase (GGDEF)-like protein/PAS domain S-box-containing protein